MTRGVCTIMKTTILLLTLVLLDMAFAAYIPPVEISAKGLRRIRRSQYCSSNLSNVLAVLCREHGYNEPFSHRDNQQSYSPPGPGLVEECCHRSCTLEQLQLYCKAPSEKKSDIIVTSNHSDHHLEDQSHSYSTSTDRQSKLSPRAETESGDSADVNVKY
ncbi:bombyxin B-5-like isoform X2 [Pseudomyrmex gracilis]|uniref:bombyxin B-5-like isoform X2 n=1 Tax=Pseudomyrmex gracilis TaxID=219809 RepID=UPI0009955883|nr:bombyxin B-5-like isoform X2 [Pseudomyrmex gracilis]